MPIVQTSTLLVSKNMIENTHDKHMTGLTFFSDVQQEHFEGQNDVASAGTRDE